MSQTQKQAGGHVLGRCAGVRSSSRGRSSRCATCKRLDGSAGLCRAGRYQVSINWPLVRSRRKLRMLQNGPNPETASKPRFRLEDRPYQSDWCRPSGLLLHESGLIGQHWPRRRSRMRLRVTAHHLLERSRADICGCGSILARGSGDKLSQLRDCH
jgi:hypothetical protein